jgi:hypothetical protein
MKIEALTDTELATCVDEYVKRVIARARGMEYNDSITVNITACHYQRNSDYEIMHQVDIGNYPRVHKASGSNALQGVVRALHAYELDRADKPTTVTAMLPAPVEEAEFEEVHEDGTF